MDYGAFVELENGLTGLLHISQISTKRIKHPGAVLKEGQEVRVKSYLHRKQQDQSVYEGADRGGRGERS